MKRVRTKMTGRLRDCHRNILGEEKEQMGRRMSPEKDRAREIDRQSKGGNQ